jgi:hypothetical protein
MYWKGGASGRVVVVTVVGGVVVTVVGGVVEDVGAEVATVVPGEATVAPQPVTSERKLPTTRTLSFGRIM